MDVGSVLRNAARGQTALHRYRSMVDRPVQHGDDDLGASFGDGPQPVEAGEAGYQFANIITFGHGRAHVAREYA